MKKIAQDFFRNQHVEVNSIEDFFKSDLCFYFEKLYKTKLALDNNGFIKVIRKDNNIILYEIQIAIFRRVCIEQLMLA